MNYCNTPEYKAWKNIKGRCFNIRHHRYSYYGGRGITMCEDWKSDFSKFYDYVGKRPNKTYSIDRINNNGNYEPGNVRWATKSEQVINRRIFSKNISGVAGVNFDKTENKWRVQISRNRKLYHIGNYEKLSDAIDIRRQIDELE